MENFFASSKQALYFIGLFFVIIQNRSKKEEKTNKNIILIYIIYSLTNIFNIINILENTVIVISICLIEMQVLMLNDKESMLLVNTRYKIIDYIFTMVNKYKIIQIIILNIFFNMFLKTFRWNKLIATIALLIEAIIFLSYISKIYLNQFRVKRLDEVEKDFLELSKGFTLRNQEKNLEQKIQMLAEIEDKTFFARANSYISLSLETILYKISKNDKNSRRLYQMHSMTYFEKIKYALINYSKIMKLSIKVLQTIVKAIIYKDGIKRYIKRGYSTIEMQLMRQLAIETGYELTYRRKIYELIYTNIFFKSLDKKRRNNNYYEHNLTYKKRIAYVYFKKVPTFIHTRRTYKKCKNIYEYYKTVRTKEEIREEDLTPERIVYALTLEETFVFILSLSGKYLSEDSLLIYQTYIKKYNLSIEKINKIIFRVDSL